VHGLRAHQEPEAARDGMGGSYFFRDPSGHSAAIFKPCDEEPLAPNNPKGWEGRAMGAPGYKPCVRVGEAALREVAAYLLDGGFAGVPAACLAHCNHPVLNYKVRDAVSPVCFAEACCRRRVFLLQCRAPTLLSWCPTPSSLDALLHR
jgi:hypothetical protein